jgi:hypothetical protein
VTSGPAALPAVDVHAHAVHAVNALIADQTCLLPHDAVDEGLPGGVAGELGDPPHDVAGSDCGGQSWRRTSLN